MMRLVVAVIAVLLSSTVVASAAHADVHEQQPDAVASLPGFATPLQDWVNMSAGFITVNDASRRRLFYTLVQSRRDPLRDPLILWLQGGPGCSSMGVGFWSELGPFHLVGGPLGSGEQLVRNNFTWAQTANVVFLESPAFTGFSTSDNQGDRDTNDQRVTSDHVAFLQQLVKRHTFLRSADLYLAGESYAGHYLPLLAAKLLAKKAQPELTGDANLSLQLRGIIAGNPWTSTLHDNTGAVEWWYGQGLISRATHDGLLNNCQLSRGALWRTEGPNGLTPGCNAWRDRAYQEIGSVNLYALNAPVCLAPADAIELPPGLPLAGNPQYDPCAGRRIEAYMNRLDVQQALNVVPTNATGQAAEEQQQQQQQQQRPLDQQQQQTRQQPEQQPMKQPVQAGLGQGVRDDAPLAVPWRRCASGVNLTYDASSIGASVEQLYPSLLRAGLRVLLLSGNEDGYVPSRGTRAWLESLGRLQLLDPKVPLRTWRDRSTGQVGGYVTTYRARTAGADTPGQVAGADTVNADIAGDDAIAEEHGGQGKAGANSRGAATAAEAHMWLGRKVELKEMRSMAPSRASRPSRSHRDEATGPTAGQAAVEELIQGVDDANRLSGKPQKESAGQLDFVVVLNAGHAVPVFQPSATLQLLQGYLSGEPLQ